MSSASEEPANKKRKMSSSSPERRKTIILPVDVTKVGTFDTKLQGNDLLDHLEITLDATTHDAQHVIAAAVQLRISDVPVAFPTETVYGLGADATRSEAVKGIYKAKGRPSDNPLIVHFASLQQLREVLQPGYPGSVNSDPIPAIYRPLIRKFWPGPLTIILPNASNSPLAPEVTAGLSTFGARVPRHPLALALISLSGRPIAAPSANASTKPSPTAAEHVAHDLEGKIDVIIDGGPCGVGVESTVVDGLSNPPIVLRPGGVGIEELRRCEGWGDVRVGYEDAAEKSGTPRAPGMKYRHYSPKARVVLFEAGSRLPGGEEMIGHCQQHSKIGLIRTKTWDFNAADGMTPIRRAAALAVAHTNGHHETSSGFAGMLHTLHKQHERLVITSHKIPTSAGDMAVLDIALGRNVADIARGVFAALRELDLAGVDAILVDGIDESDSSVAAAVMNRLRKAAEVRVGC
ncbi:hypothetical protein B0A48_14569 [Cryoendolithus antarcticus]|uniref:Threonylcarbamoyl-AMP synthase n=1 Tax=Cryoendolithus antarcticus TaxID=1507870 RepID=A0A1V8SL41_9PEZI|nr:hypothetical protein B0A48_14569 [Cryoendolithus antarcticus]